MVFIYYITAPWLRENCSFINAVNVVFCPAYLTITLALTLTYHTCTKRVLAYNIGLWLREAELAMVWLWEKKKRFCKYFSFLVSQIKGIFSERLSSSFFFYHSKAVRAEAEYFWTNDSFCKLKFQNKCFNDYRWTRSSPPTSPPSWLLMLPSTADWFPSYQLCTIKPLLCCSPKRW